MSAEEYKNAGNDFLREGKTYEAVDMYTKSIDLQASEGTLTNRAAAYIKLKKYKQALQDCEHALLLNKEFAANLCRVFGGSVVLAGISLGNVSSAMLSRGPSRLVGKWRPLFLLRKEF